MTVLIFLAIFVVLLLIDPKEDVRTSLYAQILAGLQILCIIIIIVSLICYFT